MNLTKVKETVPFVSLKLVYQKNTVNNLDLSGVVFDSSRHVYEVNKKLIGNLDREALLVWGLDTKNVPVMVNMASLGDANSTIASTREILRVVLATPAVRMLVAHNHPSGNSKPSKNDIDFCLKLADAGHVVGIDLLDSIIVGRNTFCSLNAEGFI